MGTRVRLTRLDRHPDGSYLLGFASPDRVAFAAVVAAVKDRLPYWARRYEPTERAWQVAGEAYLWELVDVLPEIADALQTPAGSASSGANNHRGSARSGYTGTGRSGPPTDVVAAFAQLCLAPNAPTGLIAQARRWWARQLHPDTGQGDTKRMQVLNAAADRAEQWAERHAQARTGGVTW